MGPHMLRAAAHPVTNDPMISVGEQAPDFSLKDHLGRTVSLASFKGKQHVMLLFYPLDFTPT